MASLRHGVEEPGDIQDIRLVVDTIPTLAWSARPDGSAELHNQRWLDYTGLSAKQALGSGWELAIHPDDLPRILETFREALKSAKPYEVEGRKITLSLPLTSRVKWLWQGPENRDGIRAGQYINDIGAPLFGRFVQLFFDVARDERLPNRDDMVVAHTWWFTIFGLATLMVIQGVVPDLPDQALVVEQTIATLWAGVQAVPRLPKSAIPKRSGRSSASKQ
jgi:PAS fold